MIFSYLGRLLFGAGQAGEVEPPEGDGYLSEINDAPAYGRSSLSFGASSVESKTEGSWYQNSIIYDNPLSAVSFIQNIPCSIMSSIDNRIGFESSVNDDGVYSYSSIDDAECSGESRLTFGVAVLSVLNNAGLGLNSSLKQSGVGLDGA